MTLEHSFHEKRPVVLYLTQAVPIPVGGNEIRAGQQIKFLAEECEVLVATFGKPSDLGRIPQELRDCAEFFLVERSKPEGLFRAAAALPTSLPLQVARTQAHRMRRLVDTIADTRQIDVMFVHILRMLPYAFRSRLASKPCIVDFQDCLSYRFRQQAEQATKSWMKLLYKEEAGRLERYERTMLSQITVALTTSEVDSRRIDPNSPIRVVPMAFSSNSAQSGRIETEESSPSIIFLGNMGTQYNEDAVLYFADKILPIIWEECPEAVLTIVGSQPTDKVQSLAGKRVTVTGFVESVTPYLVGASVAICPLFYGTGIKTKVLEPMAAGVPVVASPIANEGINASDGHEIILASTPKEFANGVLTLLGNPALRQQMGVAAQQLVRDKFSPKRVKSQLLQAVEDALDER